MKVRLIPAGSNLQDFTEHEVDGVYDKRAPATEFCELRRSFAATIVRHNGRHFVQTTLNQELWPDIITYVEGTIWEIA